jgi:ABC-type antimicrobial peptide transport system permease subunit
MALGAAQQDVRSMIVRQGLWLAIGGVAVGLAVALALARLVTKLLFVSGADPVTFLAVPAVLLAVAILATLIPAVRASRVDPVEALRT